MFNLVIDRKLRHYDVVSLEHGAPHGLAIDSAGDRAACWAKQS